MGRLQLQAALEALLGSDRVYFQPPSDINMQYPCIVYSVDQANTAFADNTAYRYTKRYSVTAISRDPDSTIPDTIALSFGQCVFNRAFTAGNLHHTVFLVYYA